MPLAVLTESFDRVAKPLDVMPKVRAMLARRDTVALGVRTAVTVRAKFCAARVTVFETEDDAFEIAVKARDRAGARLNCGVGVEAI